MKTSITIALLTTILTGSIFLHREKQVSALRDIVESSRQAQSTRIDQDAIAATADFDTSSKSDAFSKPLNGLDRKKIDFARLEITNFLKKFDADNAITYADVPEFLELVDDLEVNEIMELISQIAPENENDIAALGVLLAIVAQADPLSILRDPPKDPQLQGQALKVGFFALVRQDPKLAEEWLWEAKKNTGLQLDIEQAEIVLANGLLLAGDPGAALGYLRKPDPLGLGPTFEEFSMLSAATNHELAKLLSSEDKKIREKFELNLLQASFAQGGIEQFDEMVSVLYPEEEGQVIERGEMIADSLITYEVLDLETAEAVFTYAQAQEGVDLGGIASSIVADMMMKDLRAAGDWAEKLEDPALRDHAYLTFALNIQYVDLAAANEWALDVSEVTDNQKLQATLYDTWLKRDPERALSWKADRDASGSL